MEKDIDRIQKNAETEIVIRIDDFGGRRGLTIREFVTGDRYTGFTKTGIRIPGDKFKIFKAAINSINEKDIEAPAEDSPPQSQEHHTPAKSEKPKHQKKISADFEETAF